MPITDPALREAAGLNPDLGPSLTASEALFQSLPRFNKDFSSVLAPEMDGEVEIRFGTVGDALRIERAVGRDGFFAEVIASLTVLIDRAPASWYVPSDKAGDPPVLSLTRLPDYEALAGLYQDYSQWRGSFRHPSDKPPVGEAR